MSEHKKRYELRVYSNHTVMEGLNSPAELCKKARLAGISMIAITDRMTVCAYPELMEQITLENRTFGGIFGIELVVENDVAPSLFHDRFCVTALIRNHIGLKAVYRLLTAAEQANRGSVPLSLLLAVREHLLLGSATENGVFFHCNSAHPITECYFEAAKWFDYLEISPAMPEDTVILIHSVGEAAAIPVVAVSDGCYCYHAQQKHYEALMHANALKDFAVTPKPIYTAKQLCKIFSYLGEKQAKQAVYDAPVAVVKSLEQVNLFDDHMHRLSPQCDSISSALQAGCKQHFGENTPDFVRERLGEELAYFTKEGLLGHLQTLYELMRQMPHSYVASSYSTTLLCYLLGLTPIDPLQHYLRCPVCGAVTLIGEHMTRSHWYCPQCMTETKVQGLDLPFADFIRNHDQNKLWIIGAKADHKILAPSLQKMYPNEQFARIGASRTMPYARFRKIYRKLNRQHDHCMPALEKEEAFDRLTNLGGGVGIFAGDLGEYLITPRYLSVTDYTAVVRERGKKEGRMLTAYSVEELEKGGCTVVKFTADQAVEALQRLTAESQWQIDAQTDYITVAMAAVSQMKQTDYRLLLPSYQNFLPALADYLPLESFEDLVRILNIGHGSRLWVDNFDVMIRDGEIKADEMFTCTEELFALLTAHGYTDQQASRIVHAVCIGMGETVVDDAFLQEVVRYRLPQFLPQVLCRIRRLSGKAYAVAEADVLCRLLWYAVVDEQSYRRICMKG